ncbi:hypothetical protein F8388_012274 [Cannabis sativa]|uniref:Reverse transcriptase zinc-binding domain-containing protein n=1 Tax=Cannabis sativa TaxID=3483 RepID=A0A7J6E2V0_CANSA|nr:hypothetical protein F8388_012274 [Cannabis sativa]KAF4394935.1 hypothetical protein G4B88_002812 [Cannabis sativa]
MMPVVKENARRQEQDKTQASKDWVTPKRKAVRQMEGKAMNDNTKGSKSINCFAALQQLVMDCWNKEIAGNGLDKIMRKLFRVKHVLKAFHRAEVGDVRKDYKEAKETFCNIQEEAAKFPNDVFIQQSVKEKQRLFLTAKVRMSLAIRQQSKVNWVKFSDENSSYFHAIMRKRRLENRITTFMKGDVIIDDYEKVVNHFIKHFENFMGSKSSATSIIDEESVKHGNCLNLEQQDQSIWDYAKKDDASWYFKKILSIRENLDEAKLQQAARGDKFSAKKCYNSLVGETPFAYANAIWDTLVLPKHRFIFWQIANSHLLTRDYLHHIMVTPNNLCPVCDSEVETHDHIFFNCYYTSQVFEAVNRWLGDFHWPRSTVEMLQYCSNATKDLTQRILNAVMAAVFYFLWKNRNKCVFDFSCMVPSKLSLEVRKIVQLRVVCKGPFKEGKRHMYLTNVVNSW